MMKIDREFSDITINEVNVKDKRQSRSYEEKEKEELVKELRERKA